VTFREAIDVYRGYRVPRLRVVEHTKRWFAFSGALILLSLIGLLGVRLTYSIEFEGGAQITYPNVAAVTIEQVQDTLATFGIEGEVQIVGATTISIRTASLAETEVRQDLMGDLAAQAGTTVDQVNVEDIGPTWGAQISRKALQGLVLVLAAISLYIAWRFEWRMAVGALIALVHDIVITGGIYALTGRPVTPETVVALLTILGFSLYDTVVIFDKIRENTSSAALVARLGYARVVDRSLNQVLMRSVNTSLVVVLPISSLLLFGGETLKDFAFAMFVGTAIGAYSSIFIAAPIVTLFHRHDLAPRVPGVRPAPGARVAAAPTAAATRTETAAATPTSSTPRQGARPRPSSKRRPPARRKRR